MTFYDISYSSSFLVIYVTKLFEVWWNLDFTLWPFEYKLLIEQAEKIFSSSVRFSYFLFAASIKFSLNLIGYILSIIPSLVSLWRRALFLGVFPSENPSLSLTICCNLFFSFLPLECFVMVYISFLPRYMKTSVSDSLFFSLVWTVISVRLLVGSPRPRSLLIIGWWCFNPRASAK